jgi:GAF domain-containing protein
VLLTVQPGPASPRVAASKLPAGESVEALLHAVTPWLDEALHTGTSRLRHGPERAAPAEQRSCLVAPLPSAQGLQGCLYADVEGTHGRANRFEEAERALLAALAEQAGVALAYLRATRALQQEVAQRSTQVNETVAAQQATAEVLQIIGSSLGDPGPVFDKIVASCEQLFSCYAVSLFLNDDADMVKIERFQWTALGRKVAGDAVTTELEKRVRSVYPIPVASTVWPAMAERGGLLDLRDVLNNPEASLSLRRSAQLMGVSYSSLSVLMTWQGRRIGAIGLTRDLEKDYSDTQGFSPSEHALLKTFADQAVVAIQNAQMFRETKEALERQTATTEVLQVINASPGELAPVFEAIVQRASRLCAADGGGLWLADGDRARFSGGQSQMPEAYLQAESAQGDVPLTFLLGREWQRCPYLLVPDVRDTDAYRNRLPFFVDSVDLGLIRTYLGVPLVDDRGQVVGVFTLVRREVRPFNAAQIALVQSFAAQAQLAMKNARLMNETREALELQQASADVLSVISSSVADTGPVFDKILQACERLFPAMVFNLHLVDEAGLLAVERIHATAPALAQFGREPLEAFHAAVRSRYPMPLAGTHAELAFRRGGLVEISDLMKDPDAPRNLRATVESTGQSGSALIAPLMWEGRGIGVILAGRAPGPFLPKERTLLKTFADQAVIAIQNAKMFRETQEALAHQTASADILRVISSSPTDVQPVFEAIVGSGRRLLNCTLATVLRTDGQTFQQVAVLKADGSRMLAVGRLRPVDPDHDFPSRVIVSKTALHLPDWTAIELPAHEAEVFAELGCHASLMLPLMRAGACIGVLGLLRIDAGPFSKQEMALAGSFCDHAVIAIENVRLFNETQEALSHQTASADILRVISSSPTDVHPVFEAIVGTAVKHLGCDLALVQTVNGDTYSPRAMATPAGLTPVPGAQAMPVDPAANFPSRAIRSKTMLHVPDWTAVELPAHEQVRHQQLGLNSALYLPLLRGDECVGVLVLGSRKANAFNAKAIALVESFRDQALIAIENTRLFNETREALERQTATAEVLQVIGRSVADAQPVFDRILESCRRLFDPVFIGINLLRTDGLIDLQAFFGPREAEFRSLYPLRLDEQSGTALVIRQRDAVHFADAQTDDGVPAAVRRGSELLGSRSVVFAPLMWQDRGVGSIFIGRSAVSPFSQPEIALIKTFADQAVIAIQNARLFRETNESLERQTATAEILAVISESPTDVQPVFQAIAERARALCGADIGATTRLDGDVVHLAGVRALSTQAEDAMRGAFPMAVDAAAPNIRRAIVEQQPIQIADVRSEPGYPDAERAERMGFRSILSVPLLLKGRSIGTIGVARREPGRFADGAVALLQTFARQAVIAIENVRLFNETEESLQRQTATAEVLQVISSSVADSRPVFEKILDSCRDMFDANQSGLMLLDDTGQLSFGAVRGIATDAELAALPAPAEKTAFGEAIRERRVCHYSSVLAAGVHHGLRAMGERGTDFSIAFAPMVWHGRGVGGIAVGRVPPRAFTDKELALLETFADQAVIAIQNAKMFRETNEALQRQTATAEILKVIAGSPSDVQPVFDAIARSTNRLLGAHSTAAVRIADGMMHLMAFTSTTPEGDAAVKRAYPIVMSSGLGDAMLRGELVRFPDTERVPDEASVVRDVARARGYRSQLMCPMLRDGVAIGLISVTWREPGDFAPHTVELLQTFADQAVIAIQNVRLFNETKETLERQTATADVLQVISGSMADAKPVFEKILDNCERLFGGGDMGLFLAQGEQLAAAAYRGRMRDEVQRVYPKALRGSVSEYVMDRGVLLHSPAVRDDQALPAYIRDMTTALGDYSLLVAPLRWNGRSIGTIDIARNPPRAFSADEQAQLQTFADQAVIAIQNARLFNETKEALERQTAMAEVLQVISRSPTDVQPVLDVVARRAAELCEADWDTVWLVTGPVLRMVAYALRDTERSPQGDPGSLEMPLQATSPSGRAAATGAVVHVPDVVPLLDSGRQPKPRARVPGRHEPRDPDADERDHRHERAAPGHPTRRRAARLRHDHPGFRRCAADDHQRHPRLLQDRGRAHGHGAPRSICANAWSRLWT